MFMCATADRYIPAMARTWSLSLAVLVLAALLLGSMGAQAAYSAVCQPGPNSSGHCTIDYQITKDCCTAVANGQKGWHSAQQHFDEPSHNCLSNNVAAGNSVNAGDVAKCCSSRGVGSAASPKANQNTYCRV